MHKLGKELKFSYHAWNYNMDPSLLITWNIMLLQSPQIMGYRQWLHQWTFYNTRKFKFTMKRLHSKWSYLLGEDLELLAMSSLAQSSDYLPQIFFVYIYMTKALVYACMPL